MLDNVLHTSKCWTKRQTKEQLHNLFTQWFASEAGARLLNQQCEYTSEALTRCFGYHLLQLSIDNTISLFDDCRVQKKYRAHPFASDCDTRCLFDELPFANESLDAVIVHHAHELVDNPHQILREVQRVVVPHGQLIIIGFNPWSKLGLYSRIAGLVPSSMWQNKLISSYRMKDWLGLLGFETRHVEYGFRSPQYLENNTSPWIKEKLRYWPLGDFYIIRAIKQLATMTPVKMRWTTSRKQFAGLSVIKPRVPETVNHRCIKEDVA